MTKQMISLRLDQSLLASIDERAEAVGLSRTAWMERALTFALLHKGATLNMTTKVTL